MEQNQPKPLLNWNEILEGSLTELFKIERRFMELELYEFVSLHQAQLFYVRILIAYNRLDLSRMHHLIETERSSLKSEWSQLIRLAELRLQIRQNQIALEEFKEFASQPPKDRDSLVLCAEASFVSGAAHLIEKQFSEAEDFFKKASILFEKSGSIKKSLRSTLSALAAFSCFQPKARLFYEYTEVVEKCLQAQEYLSAATALTNISREFQILRAQPVALDYIDQALSLFEKHDRGSREHGLALVHRAHLYAETNLTARAQANLLYALSIGHKDVQSACKVMAEKFHYDLETLPAEQMLPTWEERMKEPFVQGQSLSPLESKLIELLSKSPQDKFALMDSLYGDLISFESKEGRFKNLLARLRQRYPDLIYLRDQKYYLSDVQRIVG